MSSRRSGGHRSLTVAALNRTAHSGAARGHDTARAATTDSEPRPSGSVRRALRRGGALLMVLWLSAALSAIALSVALSVRSEITRADTAMEGLRAYYLACGAADRAVNYMLYGPGPRNESGVPQFWEPGIPLLRFAFPEGEAAVEVIPESSKLNVNQVSERELAMLLQVLGVPPEGAQQIVMAVMHWRGGSGGPLDQMYLMRSPSFRAPHASLEQIEELMSIAGITPELFHGGYTRTPQGGLVPRPGLRDCLSVYSASTAMDLNTAEPAVMLALGAPLPGVEAVVNLRRQLPIRQPQAGPLLGMLGPAGGRFRLGGDSIYTLRATARMKRPDGVLSDLRRTVAMTVQIYSKSSPDLYRVLAWQDQAAGQPIFSLWPQ